MNLSISDKIDLYLQKGLELLDRLYRDMIENNIRYGFCCTTESSLNSIDDVVVVVTIVDRYASTMLFCIR